MSTFGERYQIKGQLGSGGTGAVYEAFDEVIQDSVALKLLAAGEDLLAVREASALRALSSDYVVPVLNAGTFRDVPFVVTEIARGGSVEDRVRNHPEGLDVSTAIRWARQMLVGLDYCHRLNILHRDVTPGNVFLDNEDHARLGDFGTATNLRADGTADRMGNQRVVAPEGYETGILTVKSEIFSAGVTIWRMLTGQWPYEAQTESEMLALVRSDRRPRLRDLAPHVPRSVADAVERALASDPEQRYTSAAALREALAECSLSDRRWKPIPRHDGHERCWTGTFPAGPVSACITRSDSTVVVETRRGTGRRIAEGCFETPKSKAGPVLRRLFDHL